MFPNRRFFRNTLSAAGVLALVASFATPALAQGPSVNLTQLAAQVAALQTTVNNDHATIASLQTTVNNDHATINNLQTTVNNQAATITALQTLTSPLSLNGTPGTSPATLSITGVNVQIANGLGPRTINGLGNLTIGYNDSQVLEGGTDIRTGSHNLILGDGNNYSAYGGIVDGVFNTSANVSACVLSGGGNIASGQFSVVLGGELNTASGIASVVTGGNSNTAPDVDSIAP